MKKTNLATLTLLLMITLALPYKAFATSWAYPFVVWDGYIYVISEESVTDIEKEIGKVTKYSDMEPHSGNFSNSFPKGTKYYSIKGVDTNIAIAIEKNDGEYIKAYNEGKYEYQNNLAKTMYIGFGIFALLVGVLIFTQKRNEKCRT